MTPTAPRVRRAISRVLRGVVAAVVLALLAGCTSLPTDGPVVQSDRDARADDRRASDIDPRPPAPGASPSEIVTGFLDAMTAWPISTTTAKRYLTSSTAERWDPTRRTIVYDDLGPVRTAASAVQVSLDGAELLDASGSWKGPLSAAGSMLRMRLTLENGEYRIVDPTDALVVPSTWFQQRFRQVSLFFVDPLAQVVVPEPVFVPAGEQLATNLVTGLLSGPPASARGIVRTYLPPGLSVGLSVTVDEGVARVALVGDASGMSDDDVAPLLAQLAWTLRQVPDVRALRVTLDGRDLQVPGTSVQYPVSAAGAYDPAGESSTDRLFGLAAGRLVAGTGADLEPVTGPFGATGAGVVDVAVRPDGQTAAVVDAGGSRVQVGAVRDEPAGATARTVLRGGPFARPTWDVAGRLWVLEQRRGGAVVHLVEKGVARQVAVPGVTGAAVRRIVVSRDGTRLVSIVRGSGSAGDRVLASRVRSDTAGRVVDVGSPVVVREANGVTIADLAWSTPIRLALLVPTQGRQAAVVETRAADGATLDTDTLSTVLPGDVRSIAAAPGAGTPLVAVYDDRYYDPARQASVTLSTPVTSLHYAG